MVLTELRDAIQEVDKEILSLIEKRIEYAKKIGEIKKESGDPIYNPTVEAKKISTLSTLSKYPGLVEVIWPVIMCYTRTIE